MEQWKPINGYEGIYEVSNHGHIRTCDGKTTTSTKHGTRTWSQKILKQKTDNAGRKRIMLWKNKLPKTFLVHRLVAAEFCYKEEGKDIINHIDGNPSNNHHTNLEWCTHYENTIHAFKNGLITTSAGVKLVNKVTNEEHVFYSMAEGSKFLGFNSGYISLLLKRGKTEASGYSIVPF